MTLIYTDTTEPFPSDSISEGNEEGGISVISGVVSAISDSGDDDPVGNVTLP